MNLTLMVVWQEPVSRTWSLVGKLKKTKGVYSFAYHTNAPNLAGFSPFWGMPDFGKVYQSRDLFPLFQNRIMNRSRSEFQEYLHWLGLTPEQAEEELEILARSGGEKATDSIQLFELPTPDQDQNYNITFFVHGIRYQPEEVQHSALQLQPGQALEICPQPQNQSDPHALGIARKGEQKIFGFCPRFLCEDLLKVMQNGQHALRVLQVNPHSPIQFRLRCNFVGPWPKGFHAFADPLSGIQLEIDTHKIRA